MKKKIINKPLLVLCLLICVSLSNTVLAASLSSWNDGQSKQAIVNFVEQVTNESSPKYVKPEERIAVFDNDGTVQLEKPFSFIDVYAFKRIQELAPLRPEWKDDPVVERIVDCPEAELGKFTTTMSRDKDFLHAFALGNSGQVLKDIEKATYEYAWKYQHPRFLKPPAKLVYKPMVELIRYLKDNGFTVYLVSGSTTDYLRSFCEQSLGITRNHVLGWDYNAELKADANGKLAIFKGLDNIEPVTVEAGKVINIARNIGIRPIFAVGNSQGDIEMLTYTHQNKLPSLSVILHHDDSEREYAYDFGVKAWEVAKQQGWVVVEMKEDFRAVFE
jgi:phosphoserine phosphatase